MCSFFGQLLSLIGVTYWGKHKIQARTRQAPEGLLPPVSWLSGVLKRCATTSSGTWSDGSTDQFPEFRRGGTRAHAVRSNSIFTKIATIQKGR